MQSTQWYYMYYATFQALFSSSEKNCIFAKICNRLWQYVDLSYQDHKTYTYTNKGRLSSYKHSKSIMQ